MLPSFLARRVLSGATRTARDRTAKGVLITQTQNRFSSEASSSDETGVGDAFSSICSKTVSDTIARKEAGGDAVGMSVRESATVFDAVKRMNDKKVGSLVVMNDRDELRGIITERDYLHKVKVQGRSSRTTKVSDIMTGAARLVTVTPDTQVFKTMQIMTQRKFRHMPVVKKGALKDGKLATKDELMGLVSIGDCVFDVVNELGETVAAMESAVMGQSSGGGAAALCRGTVGNMLNRKVERGRGTWLHVGENETVLAAIKKMTDADVGSLVVFSENLRKEGTAKSELRGILTERDYLQKIVVLDRTSADTSVSDIMTASNKLITVEPSAVVYDCLRVMTDNRIRHLPVVKPGAHDDGVVHPDELVGMVSIGDCVHNVVSELEEHIVAMQEYVGGNSY